VDILRIYSDADGESHFEDVRVDLAAFSASGLQTASSELWPDRQAGWAAGPAGPGSARRPRAHPAHRPAGQAAARRRHRPVMAARPHRALGRIDPTPPGQRPLVPQLRQTRPRRKDLPGHRGTVVSCAAGRGQRRGSQVSNLTMCGGMAGGEHRFRAKRRRRRDARRDCEL
jgi:hypothetical protein